MGSCRVSCGSHSCYYNDFIQATDPGDLPPSVVYEKAEKQICGLTSDLPFPELNELIDGINDIVDQSREIREDVWNNEARLKQTITNLSHDIRTPLTSLDGYFQASHAE